VENLDAPGGHQRFDIGAGEAVRDGIVVGVDVEVIVDADPGGRHSLYSQTPSGSAFNAGGRPPRAIGGGDAEPAQRLALVELGREFAERGVVVGEAMKDPAPEAAQKPALDDQDGLLDLRPVAALSWF
jgi:hypothetical protein